jgi:hypothetical protein
VSKKGVFIAVMRKENPTRNRNRTVMNFARSTIKLKIPPIGLFH